MSVVKKIPMRMCVACKQMRPKRELIRIVKDAENHVFVDMTGKMNGRGAYICKNECCLEIAQKAKRLEKIFERPIDTDVYNVLAEKIARDANK